MTRCPVCDSRTVRTIADGGQWRALVEGADDPRRGMLETGLRLGWTTDFAFVRCEDCGFVAIDPMPDPALLGRIYESYQGTESYGRKEEKKLRRAARRIGALRKYAASGRFLDIGCNLGYAVEAARRAGFDATGIDLDVAAIEAARTSFPACGFRVAPLDALVEEGQAFDLVFCSEVIEHVPDVRHFAEGLSAVMKPGATLYLTTPDAGHPRVPRGFIAWDAVKPPEHICFFTRGALGRLMRDHGIEVQRFALNLKPGLKMVAKKAA